MVFGVTPVLLIPIDIDKQLLLSDLPLYIAHKDFPTGRWMDGWVGGWVDGWKMSF